MTDVNVVKEKIKSHFNKVETKIKESLQTAYSRHNLEIEIHLSRIKDSVFKRVK
jgi:hypothetical protein